MREVHNKNEYLSIDFASTVVGVLKIAFSISDVLFCHLCECDSKFIDFRTSI